MLHLAEKQQDHHEPVRSYSIHLAQRPWVLACIDYEAAAVRNTRVRKGVCAPFQKESSGRVLGYGLLAALNALKELSGTSKSEKGFALQSEWDVLARNIFWGHAGDTPPPQREGDCTRDIRKTDQTKALTSSQRFLDAFKPPVSTHQPQGDHAQSPHIVAQKTLAPGRPTRE